MGFGERQQYSLATTVIHLYLISSHGAGLVTLVFVGIRQTGWNWTCPCAKDNHPLRVAPAGGTALTRPNHPKQRGPCGRKYVFCGVIPLVNCLNNLGCGYTLQMNPVINGMLTTSPTIGPTSSRTTDKTIIFLSN